MNRKKIKYSILVSILSTTVLFTDFRVNALENDSLTNGISFGEIKPIDIDKTIENVVSTSKSDLFTYSDLVSFVGDSFEIYSHTNSIKEDSTIEFKREDGSIVSFKSEKDNDGIYYYCIKPDKAGNWSVYSVNGTTLLNDKSLSFSVYDNINDYFKPDDLIYPEVRSSKYLRAPSAITNRRITRYSGNDRIETAVNISNSNFNSAHSAIIVNGWKQSDAIAASALAKNLSAPILYVNQYDIPYSTKNELERLDVKNIYVIGGDASVSDEVKNDLYSTVRPVQNVERISGSDRYETALNIAKKAAIYSKGNRAFIVSGRSESDCLAVSAASAENGCLMFYSNNSGELDYNSRNYISNNFSGVYVMNGDKKVNSSESSYFRNRGLAVTNINGYDSYDLNMKLARNREFYTSFNSLYLASGNNSADGIPGSPLAARKGVPLILVNNTNNTSDIVSYIKEKNVSNIYIFGGTNSVPTSVENEIRNDNSGSQETSTLRKNIVSLALQQEGKRYLWAEAGPDKFDCSGLVKYVFEKSGVKNVPRTSGQQFLASKRISSNAIRPGDLVFFGNPVHHVGICIGDGKFINAEGTKEKPEYVRIRNLSYYTNTISGYGNLLND